MIYWGAHGPKPGVITGKASQRLQEVVQLDTSSTVHRLLQYRAAGSLKDDDDEEDVEGSYTFCRSNPLPADAVLVDEASMLDLTLTAALLDALAPKTQLVLVGESFTFGGLKHSVLLQICQAVQVSIV